MKTIKFLMIAMVCLLWFGCQAPENLEQAVDKAFTKQLFETSTKHDVFNAI